MLSRHQYENPLVFFENEQEKDSFSLVLRYMFSSRNVQFAMYFDKKFFLRKSEVVWAAVVGICIGKKRIIYQKNFAQIFLAMILLRYLKKDHHFLRITAIKYMLV